MQVVLKKIAGRMARWISPLFMPIMEAALEKDSKDIRRWMQRQALLETGKFVEEFMPSVQSFPDKFTLLSHAVSSIDQMTDGIVCEFGVATGETINYIADLLPDKTLYGFDSFEGLPENWRDGFPKGYFKLAGLPEVRNNVKLIKGLFSETLHSFLNDNPGKISFLHIDCDLYSSTKTVFDEIGSRICPGTVICFDEYFNYFGWQEGEYKAFMTFIENSCFTFSYLGYCRYNEQVSVKIHKR
jgi:predicted O-methyltransferase YrrM